MYDLRVGITGRIFNLKKCPATTNYLNLSNSHNKNVCISCSEMKCSKIQNEYSQLEIVRKSARNPNQLKQHNVVQTDNFIETSMDEYTVVFIKDTDKLLHFNIYFFDEEGSDDEDDDTESIDFLPKPCSCSKVFSFNSQNDLFAYLKPPANTVSGSTLFLDTSTQDKQLKDLCVPSCSYDVKNTICSNYQPFSFEQVFLNIALFDTAISRYFVCDYVNYHDVNPFIYGLTQKRSNDNLLMEEFIYLPRTMWMDSIELFNAIDNPFIKTLLGWTVSSPFDTLQFFPRCLSTNVELLAEDVKKLSQADAALVQVQNKHSANEHV